MLDAISPVDGRYAAKTQELKPFFSEMALIKYRIRVEIEYFLFLSELGLFSKESIDTENLRSLYIDMSLDDARRVKEIEQITNHDVKAVEYFIKEKISTKENNEAEEFIHFGLTSQDINNTALPLMIKESLNAVFLPVLDDLLIQIEALAKAYLDIPMLARTHGQPASPTTLGKEMYVFVERIKAQILILKKIPFKAKFGGASGNLNAHKLAYPKINWLREMDTFIHSLGLKRFQLTTQISHYDDLAELFHALSRVNTILIDFCRDIWTYISMNYFRQKVNELEVGSSAMPHKVNPIDFENAEGNLSYANALFIYLAGKLPISRLQRDLTDSTVTRNIGVPFAHSLIALKSLVKGIRKLELNQKTIEEDLQKSWPVVAEGIQTILRREGFEKPYELLKEFSRGKEILRQEDFLRFINQLNISDSIKEELKLITPFNYLGYSNERIE